MKMLKDGIADTAQGRYLNALVDGLNNQIQLMKDAGLFVRDDANFEFALDSIYYSPAQDEIIAKWKEVGDPEQ